jgi:hypothetical protein
MNQVANAVKTTTAIVPGDRLKARDPSSYKLDDLKKAINKRVRTNVAPAYVEAQMGKASIKHAVDAYVADHVKRFGHDRDIILTQEELQERTRRGNAQGLVAAFLNVFKGEDQTKQSADENDTYKAVRVQASMRKITARDPDHFTTIIGRFLFDNKVLYNGMHARDKNTYLNRTKITPDLLKEIQERLLSLGL